MRFRRRIRWLAVIAVASAAVVPAQASAASSGLGPGLIGQLTATRLPAPQRGLVSAPADRPDPARRSRSSNAAAALLPSGTWQPLGPAAIGPTFLEPTTTASGVNSGRVTAIAVIPRGAHAGRIVLGSASGGIWTSDDNGTTWTARTDGEPDLAIGAVAVDPASPDHLIAGTGEANQSADSFYGDGILVSTDGGDSWTRQDPGGVFDGSHVAQVAIDPSNSSHQFAATDRGLYVTSDGGASWAKPTGASYTAFDGKVTAVVIDPNHPPNQPNPVYIAGVLGGSHWVARSLDGGVHWGAFDSGISFSAPGQPGALVALAISGHSNPSTLYASLGSTGSGAVYKTTTSSSNWSAVTVTTGDFWGGQGWYNDVVALDPANENHVIAGGVDVVASGNGGSTWDYINNGHSVYGFGGDVLHPDTHALAFAPDGSVWIGDDGGVYHWTPDWSAPASGTVTDANGNLNITQFYFGFNVVGNTLLAGSQDNASSETTSTSLGPWTGIYTGDGGPSATTPNDASLQFTEDDQHLYMSPDGFSSPLEPIATSPTTLFTPPMIVIPNTSTPAQPTVFFGAEDLYKSTSWSSGEPLLSAVTNTGGGSVWVSAITYSPASPNVVYVGFTNGTIEVSTDGGATFTALAHDPDLTGDRWITGLSVNPANPQEVIASVSYADVRDAPGIPHVELYDYSTGPGSGTWTSITGSGLPDAVSRVIYDGNVLIATTDDGVYATGAVNGSSTVWSALGTGLPSVQVQDAVIANQGLYILTHGRGAWFMPLTPAATVAPSLSGIATQGQTLQETQGAWTNQPTALVDSWQRCDGQGTDCAAISGASAESYQLTAADVGHTILVQETASNGFGSGATVSSAPTAVVAPQTPANTAPPAIAGAPTEGLTLTELHGAWTQPPSAYSFQWEDCNATGAACQAIAGATSQTYTLAAGDVGHAVLVQETAFNITASSSPASSSATAVVAPQTPANTALPRITGAATEGRTLTELNGAWTPAPSAYSFQWEDCNAKRAACQPIARATNKTYTLAAGDVGHTVLVHETAVNITAPSIPASSSPTAVVTASAAMINAALRATLRLSRSASRAKSVLKHRGYEGSFPAPSAGVLVVNWHAIVKSGKPQHPETVLVATVTAHLRKAGRATYKLTLTRQGSKLVKTVKHLKLSVAGTFHPAAGRSVTITVRLVLG